MSTTQGQSALPANQSTNVAQVAGTTTDTNSGTKSAGTQRVVIATDQPALTNKLLVTPDSVALPANQSVNVAQMNATTITMGNGVAGTGVQRVTVASDSTGQIALASGSNSVGFLAQPTTINNGKTTVTTAGTRVTLASSTAIKSVTIKALSTNTGLIYIGNASVSSSNGLQLLAGESVSMDIANLNTVNLDSSVNGEGVTYAAVT